MRKSVRRWCRRGDHSDGQGSTAYAPPIRPLRVAMPVMFYHESREARSPNVLPQENIRRKRDLRTAARHGALRLSHVPQYRSIADAYGMALAHSRPWWVPMEDDLAQMMTSITKPISSPTETLPIAEAPTSTAVVAGPPPRALQFFDPNALDVALSPSRGREVVSAAHCRLWERLSAMALDGPAYGPLASRGKALVESHVTAIVSRLYPRLRASHVRLWVQSECSPMLTLHAAKLLGMTEILGVSMTVDMWREISICQEKIRQLRHLRYVHFRRKKEGDTLQSIVGISSLLRRSRRALSAMPCTVEDIFPTVEWIQQHVWSFIAFVELALGPSIAKNLLDHLFGTSLVRTEQRLKALRLLHRWAEENPQETLPIDRVKKMQEAAKRLKSNSLSTPTDHPLTRRADILRRQRESTGGIITATSKYDADDNHLHSTKAFVAKVAYRVISELAIRPVEEVGVLLRYSSEVQQKLNTSFDAMLDPRVEVMRSTDSTENPRSSGVTNNDARQSFRIQEFKECSLRVAGKCVGRGRGETITDATDNAATNMLLNYYVSESATVSRMIASLLTSGRGTY